jgi:hypothetical protein
VHARKRLSLARRRRHQASVILNELRCGDRYVEDILKDPPDALGPIRVYVMLHCCPRLGEKGVDKLLKKANVWPTTRISKLSESQLTAILDHLPDRARRRSRTASLK